jgi:tRNA uridine 5-carbamoylmethylation protein Kti12
MLQNYWNSFCLIILNRPLETCLTQNRQRDRQVPNKVIEEMYSYKEEPNDEVKKVFEIRYE